MNSIHMIVPYKSHGAWVFDDPDRGILREPFVMGAGEAIDAVLAYLGWEVESFRLYLCDYPSPLAEFSLDKIRDEAGGAWYRLRIGTGEVHEGWLCPVLTLYLPGPPEKIFLRFERLPGDS